MKAVLTHLLRLRVVIVILLCLLASSFATAILICRNGRAPLAGDQGLPHCRRYPGDHTAPAKHALHSQAQASTVKKPESG